ncbi:hypothetical protein [Methylobacterium thuringiense]|uniref:Uncharacterized protein n=1 Tax=Methylobacterium thuringiense TaxID=1003091 RepID=A0ABQ4TIN5_9HYPH|nr:hypothetical protein [Methylobacterium thuringiense]GJE53917.1 hypothetical protein EKPJFOCH_0385 [Methylobacterium thuringiense]
MSPTINTPDVGYFEQAKNNFAQVLKDIEATWKLEMMRRARIAYHRQGGTRFPCPYLSRIVEYKKIHYAYLADSTGTLAVYRLRNKNSFRKQAKIWPKAIEVAPLSRQATALYFQNSRAGAAAFQQNI